MDGPQHYLEAEQALDLAAEAADVPDLAALLIAGAQAHATLALAAATAMTSPEMDDLDLTAWDKVAGVRPGDPKLAAPAPERG